MPITISKWTDYSMSNTSASKLSWRRSMRRESISWTRGLRRGNPNRDLIRMLILCWCRTVFWISTISIRRRLRGLVASMRNHREDLLRATKAHSIYLVSIIAKIEPLCHSSKGEVMTPTREDFQMESKMTQAKIKIESNIISFILILLKEQLKWWENNIKLHPWWEWTKKNNRKVLNITCTTHSQERTTWRLQPTTGRINQILISEVLHKNAVVPPNRRKSLSPCFLSHTST